MGKGWVGSCCCASVWVQGHPLLPGPAAQTRSQGLTSRLQFIAHCRTSVSSALDSSVQLSSCHSCCSGDRYRLSHSVERGTGWDRVWFLLSAPLPSSKWKNKQRVFPRKSSRSIWTLTAPSETTSCFGIATVWSEYGRLLWLIWAVMPVPIWGMSWMGQPAIPWLRAKPSLPSPQTTTTQCDQQVLDCWFSSERSTLGRLSPSSWAKQQPVAVPCPPGVTVAECLVWDDGVISSGSGRDGVFTTGGVGMIWWSDSVNWDKSHLAALHSLQGMSFLVLCALLLAKAFSTSWLGVFRIFTLCVYALVCSWSWRPHAQVF